MKNCFLLTIIYFTTVYSSCNKGIICNQATYSFSTGIKAQPDLDSVNINDTVWLDFSCSTNLIDLVSGGNIDYSGAENFGTDINFFEFVGGNINNPGVVAAVSAFDYKLVYGTFLPDSHLPEQNRDYNFAEVANEYKFRLGIIPKRRGIFSFSPGNAINVYRRNDRCTKAGFQITFTNTNQHLYFYEQNRPGYTPSVYEQTHMYCFKVK
jgi:hypothetical protein